jgi:hypothetical protein
LVLNIQNFEPGSPEHVNVRREFDQLLTTSTGNGFFVQILIKAIKGIGNMLVNVKLRFVRLDVLLKSNLCSIF